MKEFLKEREKGIERKEKKRKEKKRKEMVAGAKIILFKEDIKNIAGKES